VAWARPKPKADPRTKTPPSVHLRAIDLTHRLALVEVAGVSKAPSANYFTMTDDRQRHYIAQSIHCDPPFPSGARACELEIPLGYERHPLTSLELHLRGLHGKVAAVSSDEIHAAWVAAEQAHAPPTFVPGVPDGGLPPPDLGALDMAR
jgi:hypothetical protein